MCEKYLQQGVSAFRNMISIFSEWGRVDNAGTWISPFSQADYNLIFGTQDTIKCLVCVILDKKTTTTMWYYATSNHIKTASKTAWPRCRLNLLCIVDTWLLSANKGKITHGPAACSMTRWTLYSVCPTVHNSSQSLLICHTNHDSQSNVTSDLHTVAPSCLRAHVCPSIIKCTTGRCQCFVLLVPVLHDDSKWRLNPWVFVLCS